MQEFTEQNSTAKRTAQRKSSGGLQGFPLEGLQLKKLPKALERNTEKRKGARNNSQSHTGLEIIEGVRTACFNANGNYSTEREQLMM